MVGTDNPDDVRSFDIGCVRLTEKHLTSDPPAPEERSNAIAEASAWFDDLLREVPASTQAQTVVGLAGTISAIGAVELGMARRDRPPSACRQRCRPPPCVRRARRPPPCSKAGRGSLTAAPLGFHVRRSVKRTSRTRSALASRRPSGLAVNDRTGTSDSRRARTAAGLRWSTVSRWPRGSRRDPRGRRRWRPAASIAPRSARSAPVRPRAPRQTSVTAPRRRIGTPTRCRAA